MLRSLAFFLLYGVEAFSLPSVEYLKEKVCSVIQTVEGHCSQEKADHMIDLVLEVQPKVCVEIGVYGGSSLFPVAAALKYRAEGIVIGIDPWDSEQATKGFHPIREKFEYNFIKGIDFHKLFSSYQTLIDRYNLTDHCITIRSTSHRALICIPEIDILHIDGNISETGTCQDILDYLPLVRPGGFIWISDADKHRREKPLQLLQEECSQVDAIDGGRTLLFQKKGSV